MITFAERVEQRLITQRTQRTQRENSNICFLCVHRVLGVDSASQRVQAIELLLQRFELLAGLAQLSLRRSAAGSRRDRARLRGSARSTSVRCGCRRRRRRACRRTAGGADGAALAAVSDDGAAAEEGGQRRLERRSVREPILQREHDEPQLGHRAALGLQIDRLGVEQRAADGNHDQRAADARAIPAGSTATADRRAARSDRCAPRSAAGRRRASSSGSRRRSPCRSAARRCGRRSSRSGCCGSPA